jgi:hypothetical protein
LMWDTYEVEYQIVESGDVSEFIAGALTGMDTLSSQFAVWRTNNVNMVRLANA